MQTFQTMWDNSCFHCNQVITNPVCPKCLEASVKDWLRMKRPTLVKFLKDLSKEYITGTEETACIVCGAPMNLCTYCYTAEIFDLLTEKAPNLVEEFVTFFNFDLLYDGYTKKTELYLT